MGSGTRTLDRRHALNVIVLTVFLLITSPAFGQMSNEITDVSPNSATAGGPPVGIGEKLDSSWASSCGVIPTDSASGVSLMASAEG